MAHSRIGRREFSPAVRQAALQRAYYRCEACGHRGDRDALELHHRSRGDRSAFAAVVLCIRCHRLFHQLGYRQRLRLGRPSF